MLVKHNKLSNHHCKSSQLQNYIIKLKLSKKWTFIMNKIFFWKSRVATLSKVYLIVSEIIIQSLKLIRQFLHAISYDYSYPLRTNSDPNNRKSSTFKNLRFIWCIATSQFWMKTGNLVKDSLLLVWHEIKTKSLRFNYAMHLFYAIFSKLEYYNLKLGQVFIAFK